MPPNPKLSSVSFVTCREWERQRLQAMVGRIQEMVEQDARARSAAAAERLGLPPSIALPDGEYGQDAHLQLRAPYQVRYHLNHYRRHTTNIITVNSPGRQLREAGLLFEALRIVTHVM